MKQNDIVRFVNEYLTRVLGNNTSRVYIERHVMDMYTVRIMDCVTKSSAAFYISHEFLSVTTDEIIYNFIADKLADACKEMQKTRLSYLFPKGVPIDLLKPVYNGKKPMLEVYAGPPVIISANHSITVFSAGKQLKATFKPNKNITAYQLAIAMFILNNDYLGSALEMIAESDMIEHWEIQE